MNSVDAIPLLLMVLFLGVILLCALMMFIVSSFRRQAASLQEARKTNHSLASLANRRGFHPWCAQRPPLWLAVRASSPEIVQEALALDDPTPCSWIESMNGEHTLFITPPVNGWIFVIGADLPDPSEDVDACFHFLTHLSRQLGQVQLFQADPLLHYHAWARLERGRVVRAYAWAETTLWNQGLKTAAEIELDMKCFAYAAEGTAQKWRTSDLPGSNVDKVPLLAARWGLDPATVEGRILAQAHGIAGRPPRLY